MTDTAFLILKSGKCSTFEYSISHAEFLENMLLLHGSERVKNSLVDFVETNTIVGAISEYYIEVRIRSFAVKALDSLFKFLCNKGFKDKKVFIVLGPEVDYKNSYDFSCVSLDEALFLVDRLCYDSKFTELYRM